MCPLSNPQFVGFFYEWIVERKWKWSWRRTFLSRFSSSFYLQNQDEYQLKVSFSTHFKWVGKYSDAKCCPSVSQCVLIGNMVKSPCSQSFWQPFNWNGNWFVQHSGNNKKIWKWYAAIRWNYAVPIVIDRVRDTYYLGRAYRNDCKSHIMHIIRNTITDNVTQFQCCLVLHIERGSSWICDICRQCRIDSNRFSNQFRKFDMSWDRGFASTLCKRSLFIGICCWEKFSTGKWVNCTVLVGWRWCCCCCCMIVIVSMVIIA